MSQRNEYLRVLRAMVSREHSPFMEWVLRQVRLAGSVRGLREELALLRGGTEAWCEECSTPVGPFKPGVREGRCISGHALAFSEDWKARALKAEARLAVFYKSDT